MENIVLHKVIKAGNGIAIIIPVEIARLLDIQRGSFVAFGITSDKEFFVRPVRDSDLQHIKPKILNYNG